MEYIIGTYEYMEEGGYSWKVSSEIQWEDYPNFPERQIEHSYGSHGTFPISPQEGCFYLAEWKL